MKMNWKSSVLAMCLVGALPVSAYAKSSPALPPEGPNLEGPNLEEVKAKKGSYNFHIFIGRAEITAAADHHYTITVPLAKTATGKYNMGILYVEDAPGQRAGWVSATAFAHYFSPGGSFATTSPNVNLTASSKEKEPSDVLYNVNLKSMHVVGDKAVFDVLPLAGGTQAVKAPMELYKVEMMVDDAPVSSI